jgi:uroporphyrinogen decarboxylase
MNSRERMLAACRGFEVDRPPVWLMRQAGRYLPEYQTLRSRHTFWEMVRTPELAVEATLQPVRRYPVDAAILFCDILVALDAMGIEVRYENGGPVLSPQVRSAEQLAALKVVDPSIAFGYVSKAIEKLCREVHPERAVIGFAGAPFTLAAYMVEGGPARNVAVLKALAYNDPRLYEAIAGRIAGVVIDLLRMQVKAGADVVQLFDTWTAHLSPDDYKTLALPYARQVIAGLADLHVPVILYVRNAAGLLEEAGASGCHVLSIDGTVRLSDARTRLDARIGLQGNFDPALLHAPADFIRRAVRTAVDATHGTGYIVNLGQGVMPDTPVEGVSAFVNAVTGEDR